MSESSETTLYLRSLVTNADRGLVKDEVYAAHEDAGRPGVWDIPHGKGGAHCFDREDLKTLFQPVSKSEFYASLARAMEDLDTLEGEHRNITAELAGASQLALTSGDESESSSSQLAKTNPASQLRNRAHGLKRKIEALTVKVKAQQAIIESKLQQKLGAMQSQMAGMQLMVEKLQTVVLMVNLYLGRDEEIVCLRDGKKAAPETPITIRQNVLYMDEECAAQETHGIDFKEIDKFDRWLLAKKAHLQQVLPEEKGIVVLQVRRNEKKYDFGDGIGAAIMAAQMNEQNLSRSYWLIRNGDRLHRLWADIRVGEHLIPTDAEIDHFFYDTWTKERLRPGTSEYYAAMQRSDKVRQHYMMLCLVLQGILDRTPLLTPYAGGQRINLLDPATWAGQINFLRDVENTLGDGRPSFPSWLAAVNKEMRPGQRVVGNWRTYFKKDEESRFRPANASGLSDQKIYVLEQDRGAFRILFERDDEVRKGSGIWAEWGKAERRGSYRVYSHDDFVLCIDNASVADMRYYLNDRRQRRHYERMLPLLRLAIEVKERELAEEAPFRDLLLRKISEAHPDAPCSPEKLDQLIGWWKFKVREHRALLADDDKAYRMILSEYARQVSVPAEKLTRLRQIVTEHVTRYPDVLALWDAGEARFVALRSIEQWPVFAHREVYAVRKETAVLIEREEWVVPRKSDYLRWHILHESPAWGQRPESPDPKKWLSPVHDAALLEFVRSTFEEGLSRKRKASESEMLAIYSRFTEDRMEIRVPSVQMIEDNHGFASAKEIAATRKAYANPKATDWLDMPDFSERGIEWKFKSGGKVEFSWKYLGSTGTHCSREGELTVGWQSRSLKSGNIYFTSSAENAPQCRLIHLDETVMQKTEAEIARRCGHNKMAEHYSDWASLREEAEAYLRSRWVESEREKYLRESGDPDFFEDHLKTLPQQEIDVQGIRDLLCACIDACGTPALIAGKTLLQAIEIAGVTPPAGKETTPDLDLLIGSDWQLPAYEEMKVEEDDAVDEAGDGD